MKKVKRFAEGDVVEEGLGVFGSGASFARRAAKNRTIDDMSFSEAFKLKRRELGEGKVFTWRGNRYTTSTKKPEPKVETEATKPAPSKPKTETKPAPKPTTKVTTKPVSTKQEESIGRRIGEGFLSLANRGMRAAGVPAQQRTFLTTLAGSKRPITEKDFSEEELAQLKSAADKAKKAGRNYITYEDYPNELLINKVEQFSAAQAMPQTIGRARLQQKDGKTKVTDVYDFINSVRAPEVKRYRDIREKEGRSGVAKAVAKEALEDFEKGREKGGLREGFSAAINRLPSRIGNAFIGEDGRPVEINMRKGGRVKSKSVRGYGIAKKGRGRGRFVR